MKTSITLFILLLLFSFSPLSAQDDDLKLDAESTSVIPAKMSYQGVLTDNNGTPLSGTYTMSFGLYTSVSGGSPCWSESQTVQVENGIFNVLLGSITPISSDCTFEGTYYLGITVQGNDLTPRIELASTAYSFISRTVVDEAITTDKLASQSVTQDKIHPSVESHK